MVYLPLERVDPGRWTRAARAVGGNQLTLTGSGSAEVTGVRADVWSTVSGSLDVTLDDDGAGTVDVEVSSSGSWSTTVNTGSFDADDTLILAGSDTIWVNVQDSTSIETGTAQVRDEEEVREEEQVREDEESGWRPCGPSSAWRFGFRV